MEMFPNTLAQLSNKKPSMGDAAEVPRDSDDLRPEREADPISWHRGRMEEGAGLSATPRAGRGSTENRFLAASSELPRHFYKTCLMLTLLEFNFVEKNTQI